MRRGKKGEPAKMGKGEEGRNFVDGKEGGKDHMGELSLFDIQDSSSRIKKTPEKNGRRKKEKRLVLVARVEKRGDPIGVIYFVREGPASSPDSLKQEGSIAIKSFLGGRGGVRVLGRKVKGGGVGLRLKVWEGKTEVINRPSRQADEKRRRNVRTQNRKKKEERQFYPLGKKKGGPGSISVAGGERGGLTRGFSNHHSYHR